MLFVVVVRAQDSVSPLKEYVRDRDKSAAGRAALKYFPVPGPAGVDQRILRMAPAFQVPLESAGLQTFVTAHTLVGIDHRIQKSLFIRLHPDRPHRARRITGAAPAAAALIFRKRRNVGRSRRRRVSRSFSDCHGTAACGRSLFINVSHSFFHYSLDERLVDHHEDNASQYQIDHVENRLLHKAHDALRDHDREYDQHVGETVPDLHDPLHVDASEDEQEQIADQRGAGGSIEADPADGGYVHDQIAGRGRGSRDPDALGFHVGHINSSQESGHTEEEHAHKQDGDLIICRRVISADQQLEQDGGGSDQKAEKSGHQVKHGPEHGGIVLAGVAVPGDHRGVFLPCHGKRVLGDA